jgi:HemK-related putative methylase
MSSVPLKIARIQPLSRAARLTGKAMAVAYRLAGKHRYDDYRVERVQGRPFLVIPSVFNPKVPRTGAFFAAQLGAAGIRGGDVLDLGTGSGVCAVFAAQHARRVVAVDINEAAVRCAGINAFLNGTEHKIEFRCGDLFAPVHGERFDLVLFNPPFVRGIPADDRDRAWRSTDVAERFAAGLSAHLKPGGAALLLLSTYGDPNAFLSELARRDHSIEIAARRRFVNERLTLFRVTAALPPRP